MRGIKEIRIQFKDGNSHYTVFIVRRLFQKQSICVWKEKGKLNDSGVEFNFEKKIKPKVSASTLGEEIEYWLVNLKRYLVKKRGKKHCQA